MPPKSLDPFLTAPGANLYKLHKIDNAVQYFIGDGMFNFTGGLFRLIFLQQEDLYEKVLQCLMPAHNIFG